MRLLLIKRSGKSSRLRRQQRTGPLADGKKHFEYEFSNGIEGKSIVKAQFSTLLTLGTCGLLFGSLAGACSSDKGDTTGAGGDSAAGADGDSAGDSGASASGASATAGSGGGIAGAGNGGAAGDLGGGNGGTDNGGAGTSGGEAGASPDGDSGAAGGDGQEPSVEVPPVPGWVRYGGVVNDESGSVGEPSLAVDLRGNGQAVLVWPQENGTSTDIVASHYAGGVWSTAQLIDGLPGNAAEPHVTADAQGNAMAIWQQIDSKGRLGIFYARYVAKTASWTTATAHEVGAAPYNASHPRVAADAAGNVLATWNLEYGTNGTVTGTRVVSSFYNGAAQTPSWTTPQAISSLGIPQQCGRPRVALSSAGNGFVVWNDSEGADPGRRRVYAAKYLSGTFGATKALNEFTDGEAPAQIEDLPDVVMDNTGGALAVWRQVDVGGAVGVAISWFSPHVKQWTAQHDLSRDRLLIGAPALALNGSGDFAVSYWDAQFSKRQLVVAHGKIDAQGGFGHGAPHTVFESANAGNDPVLAVRKDGTALLAWTQLLKTSDNLVLGTSKPNGSVSAGTLQLGLNNGTAYPALGVFPGTDLALVTYLEAYDIHSATTSVE